MGSGSKRLVPRFITNYFGGLLVGLVGASSTLTLALLHSTLAPSRVLLWYRLRAISELAGDFDGGEGGCACGVVVVATPIQKKPKLKVLQLRNTCIG